MKKFVASVGLVALGTSGLYADSEPSAASDSISSPAGMKPWTVSAALRGFYDDNINTWPNSYQNTGEWHRSSFGFEFSPSINLLWPWEQTTVSLGYTYNLKYYQFKPANNTDHIDQMQSFSAGLDHNFNENNQISIKDSFVIGQEPDYLRAGNTYSTFSRVSGDNIRNYGGFTFDSQLTRLFGIELGYANAYYKYADDNTNNFGSFVPSLAGELNRMDQVVHFDTRWRLLPETVGIIGYQFGDTDYTGDQFITSDLQSNYRNSRSHYGYVGVDQTFTPELSGNVRVGARYTEYYNSTGNPSDVAPYAMLSLRYVYAKDSYVTFGYTYDHAATDLIGTETSSTTSSRITLDADTSVVYASITHSFTPELSATLIGDFQNSTYLYGQWDNESEQFFSVGINLDYKLNRYMAAQAGYNYDNLNSQQIGRGYDRNRVYIGLTASY